MLRLTLSVPDLANLRFAFSPLWEVVASVRVAKEPAAHALHLPWVRRARPSLADAPLLAALVPVPTRLLPGFLAPTPASALPDLDAELAELVAVSPDALRDELRATFGRRLGGPLAALAEDPPGRLADLVEQIRRYWDATLAADWPRVRGLLEGDVRYRAQRLAQGGAEHLFADLHPVVRWDGDTLAADLTGVEDHHRLDGRGLVLVPSAFIWPRLFVKVDPRWPPVLRYPPRGVATLWDGGAPVDGGLAGVLGRSRARLLAELASPASTSELARRTGLTPAGVSQHLSRLRAGGLVSAHRSGPVVLYARTPIADALLNR